jgi:hypothetical protein
MGDNMTIMCCAALFLKEGEGRVMFSRASAHLFARHTDA